MSVRDVMYDFGRWLQKKSYPNPQIEFTTRVPGLSDWCPIIPSSKSVPSWYKDLDKIHVASSIRDPMKPKLDKHLPSGNPPEWRTMGQTVKTCPGLQDMFTTGYVCPFWGSAIFEVSSDGNTISAITSSMQQAYADGTSSDFMGIENYDKQEDFGFDWLNHVRSLGYTDEQVNEWKKFQLSDNMSKQWGTDTHPQHQYQSMLKDLPPEYAQVITKIGSPWRIKTPPGISTLIMPLPYQWSGWEILPGIIHTDYYHVFNMFLLFHNRGARYNIPFKTPMCQYIPVVRNKLPYEVRQATDEDIATDNRNTASLNLNWGSSGSYRMLGKFFDNNTGGKCPFKH